MTEDQQGFLDFVGSLDKDDLILTYKRYRFLAEFGRADEVWKRDSCRRVIAERFGAEAVPDDRTIAGWPPYRTAAT